MTRRLLGPLLLVSLIALGGGHLTNAEPAPPSPHACAPADQKARLTGIKQMQRLGVLHKIEVLGPLPHVYVGPAFAQLTIDQKQTFLWVIHGYATCKGWGDMLRLRDGRTGQDIGSFDLTWGLSLK